jgi:hypothetical protein
VTDVLRQIGLAAVVLVLALATGFALQRLLHPMVGTFGPIPAVPQMKAEDEDQVRDRLAINVVSVGALTIAGLAALLLVLVGYYDHGPGLTSTGMNIFTTVLPVLATWVGTVLAFYFTKESFRQAAQSTKALLGAQDANSTLIIDSPGLMIAYDKITKIELTASEVAAAGSAAAAALKRADLLSPLFSDTVTRVIVFSPERWPLYVIRQKNMSANITTVAQYLAVAGNLPDAGQMHAINQQATISDGLRVLKLYNVADIFVTQNGTLSEPALGWVPDDHLK